MHLRGNEQGVAISYTMKVPPTSERAELTCQQQGYTIAAVTAWAVLTAGIIPGRSTGLYALGRRNCRESSSGRMSGLYPARGLTRTGSPDGNTPREEFRQVSPPIRFGQGLKAYAMVAKLFVEINKAYWVRLLVNLGGALSGMHSS